MKTRIPNRTFTPSRWRRMFCSLFFAAAAIAVFAAIGSSRAIGQGGRLARLQRRTRSRRGWSSTLPMASRLNSWLCSLTKPTSARLPRCGQRLKRAATFIIPCGIRVRATQGPILRWLRQRGLEHRSFYIVNAVLVKGTREIAEALAARPDVARVEGNPHVHIDLPQPVSAAEAPSRPRIPETIEPGINYTHAPQVWELGFTGQGIVVASADTGVRWTHNALKPHYRGWDGVNADHDYNWHDAIHDSGGQLVR